MSGSKVNDEKDEAGRDAGRMTVAACYGSRAAAVVGRRVRFAAALNAGLPATVSDLPLPPVGGRVVALNALPLSAVMSDGTVWCWTGERWERAFNLLGEAK